MVNYYNSCVEQLNRKIYGKDYLTRQVLAGKNFIDKHYSDPMDVKEMSRQAHLSKFHFIRLFKAYYGRTPYRYLIEVRMDGAKQLLRKGSSVSEASFASGFDSIPSFTRMFKKITGSTPGRFQQQKRKSNFG